MEPHYKRGEYTCCLLQSAHQTNPIYNMNTEELLKRACLPKLKTLLMQRRLSWIEHVVCMATERVPRRTPGNHGKTKWESSKAQIKWHLSEGSKSDVSDIWWGDACHIEPQKLDNHCGSPMTVSSGKLLQSKNSLHVTLVIVCELSGYHTWIRFYFIWKSKNRMLCVFRINVLPTGRGSVCKIGAQPPEYKPVITIRELKQRIGIVYISFISNIEGDFIAR